jgi:hypothetical protein
LQFFEKDKNQWTIFPIISKIFKNL